MCGFQMMVSSGFQYGVTTRVSPLRGPNRGPPKDGLPRVVPKFGDPKLGHKRGSLGFSPSGRAYNGGPQRGVPHGVSTMAGPKVALPYWVPNCVSNAAPNEMFPRVVPKLWSPMGVAYNWGNQKRIHHRAAPTCFPKWWYKKCSQCRVPKNWSPNVI